MIRFLHAADLHLGKPFGAYPEDVRALLRRARQESIGRLASAAREGQATHVLLAGDTFDAETPHPTTIRHALNAMADDAALTWVILPGNHDSLAATELWRVLAKDRPGNVLLATEAVPMDLGAATLLPAPCTVRHPGRDLTGWMDAAATGEGIRIGLAHGGVRDFSSLQDRTEHAGSAVIPPDRAMRSALDYLALGDWHGRIEVNERTWYAGTPEADSFRLQRPAGALLVSLRGHGAPAEITEIETGAINWQRQALDVYSGEDDALQRLEETLPERSRRSETLFDISVSGRMTLSERLALESAIAQVAPDFLWCSSDTSAASVLPQSDDLDLISNSGALRRAAEVLAEEAADGEDMQTRRAAEAALARLFAYAMDQP